MVEKKPPLKTTSKTLKNRKKKKWAQRAKGQKREGALLDTSLNRNYLQICICLCTGTDFIADRYCLLGDGEMMWTEFNWTRQQLHSGNRSSRDSSKMFSLLTLLYRMNICRVLLSINTLTLNRRHAHPFAGAKCNDYSRGKSQKAYVKLDSLSARISYLDADLHTRFWHLCVLLLPALLKLLSVC